MDKINRRHKGYRAISYAGFIIILSTMLSGCNKRDKYLDLIDVEAIHSGASRTADRLSERMEDKISELKRMAAEMKNEAL